MATYKILVPKPMATTEEGTEVELLTVDTIVDTKEEWKEKHMKDWVNNGWAMEVKVDDVSEVDLKLVWDPPWTKDKMSEAAKLELNL